MFKWIAPLVISIKKACGFSESFHCPCCGKKIYFCGPDKKNTVQQIIMGQFIDSIQKTTCMEGAFADLSYKLRELRTEKPLVEETESLYGQAVASEKERP